MEKRKQIEKKIKETAKKVNRENMAKVLLAEKMERRHKYIILGLTALLISFGLYISIVFVLNHTATVESTLEEIDLTEYLSYNKTEDKKVVYVATKDSDINKDYEKVLISVLGSRSTKVQFLDLAVLEKRKQIIEFMDANTLTKDTYTEPMLLVFEDGKIKSDLVGARTKAQLEAFLDANRIE
ncbi:MAG: hypothetical protein PHN72_03190 [Bacilli bacterium]|nr:hypothetical protein [Bacilli bacterium]